MVETATLPEDEDLGEDRDEDLRDEGPVTGKRAASIRRCIVTGRTLPPEEMIRFVAAPDGQLVPDVEAILPGRGMWLSAARDVVNTAVAKKLFPKAARARVSVPDGLADRLEEMLARRCLEILGLARRAGQVVAGYEKAKAELKGRRGGLVFAASDAAEGGRNKIRAMAPGLPVVEMFTSAELGAALGREAAVHVVVAPGRLAERLVQEVSRLAGFRPGRFTQGGHPQERE